MSKQKRKVVYAQDQVTPLAVVSNTTTAVGAARAANVDSCSMEFVNGVLAWVAKGPVRPSKPRSEKVDDVLRYARLLVQGSVLLDRNDRTVCVDLQDFNRLSLALKVLDGKEDDDLDAPTTWPRSMAEHEREFDAKNKEDDE